MNVDFKNWFGTKKRPWQPPPAPPPLSPFIPPAPGMYHINPIINGQRYQPPAGLPQWSYGDIEFPVEQQLGTIMKRVIEPLPHGGRMSIDYELSGPVDQLLGSADRTDYVSAGLFFIRRGDVSWSGRPPLEHKTRWYSYRMLWTVAGRHTTSVPLVFSEWGGATVAPDVPPLTEQDFAEALADPEWIGMVLGDRTGRAHSWIAPVPGIRLTIHSLEAT